MAERSKAHGDGVDAPETPATETAAEALDNAANAANGKKREDATPVRTAADIVADNEARKAEAEKSPAPATGTTTTATRPVVKKTTAKKPVAKKTTAKVAEPGKGRAALTAANNGFNRVRNLIASAVWLVAVLCAAVLALGALFTALSQTNDSNEIVKWVLARGADLVGPFGDLFKLETAKNTLLVNWGIAALAYLVVGKIAERIIRP